MKKITLIGLSLCLANMVIGHAHAEEKWTYDKAMESHKKNVGSSYIDHQARIDEWNSVNRIPENTSVGGGNNNEKYIELFKGECRLGNTCSLSDNINNYATVVVGANNQHGRLNTAVFPTDGLIGQELNMSTNTSGDGNDLIHLKFPSRTTLQYVGAKYTGIITNVWGINKQPHEPAECSTGQVQNENIYCASPQRTCETGTRQKSCNNGYWSPSSTIRNPTCVSQSQHCP